MRQQIITKFQFLCKKIKIKTIKIYFCIFNENLKCGKEWKGDGMQFLKLNKPNYHA